VVVVGHADRRTANGLGRCFQQVSFWPGDFAEISGWLRGDLEVAALALLAIHGIFLQRDAAGPSWPPATIAAYGKPVKEEETRHIASSAIERWCYRQRCITSQG